MGYVVNLSYPNGTYYYLRTNKECPYGGARTAPAKTEVCSYSKDLNFNNLIIVFGAIPRFLL